MPARHWSIWSLTPDRRNWLEVAEDLPKREAIITAEQRTKIAAKHGLPEAQYIALPKGERPGPEHVKTFPEGTAMTDDRPWETCPRHSPETDRPCVLLDTAVAHRAGHESASDGVARAVWGTDEHDRLRWAKAAPDGCDGVWHVTTPREPACPKCGETGPQVLPRWYAEPDQVLTFGRVLADAELLDDDTAKAAFDYIEKPYKWDPEHAIWDVSGHPTSDADDNWRWKKFLRGVEQYHADQRGDH
jgi:hypothetical protein